MGAGDVPGKSPPLEMLVPDVESSESSWDAALRSRLESEEPGLEQGWAGSAFASADSCAVVWARPGTLHF